MRNDDKLRDLLGTLLVLINKHGPRSTQVREFVREHKEVPEFVDLAAVSIFTAEKSQKIERNRSSGEHRAADGKPPADPPK